MKRFSKFLFGIVLFGTSILGVNAQINENVTDYVEDKFFVGSTRFDGNQIIYANDVIAATQNQIKLNLALGMNPFDALTQEIPVYTYSSLFGEWYIQEEDGFKPITDEEEIKKIEENLDIFFVNNVEKELTFEYDGDVTVHHPNVTHEGGVFTLPATLFSFDFEENGVIYSVYTKAENGYTSDLDYGNFAIVEVSDIVAMVGNVPYENLQDAVNASSEDDPAVLLDDLTLTETLLLDGENTDNVLNLNEKTLKGVNGEKLLRVDGKNNTLTILNGTIDFNGSTYIEVGNKTQDEYSNKLIVNSDVTMNAGTYGIVLRGDESSLEFNGTLNLSGEDGLAILGNGTVDQAGTDIKIGTSAKVFANGNGSFAFYLPQAGNVTIEGGEFEADTVIGIKAGTLTINGGEFTAIGEKRTPVRSENGINPTGDVIYIEQNSSYADNIKINVADDAVFTSTNGYLIQEYNVDNDKKAIVTGKYTVSHELEKGRYYDDTVVYTTNEQLSSTFNSTDVLQNKVFDVTLNAGDYDFLRINNRDKNHTISKVYIKGSGEESTTLNGFMIDAANDAANEYGKTNIKVLKISDLTFTDEVSIGIENVGQSEVNKVDYVIFENVTFDHNGRSGVFFQGLADLESVKNIVFKDCTFKNVKYGILAKHMNGANITVEDCVFEDLGYNGIQLDNNLSGTIVIDNNDFINTVDRPIRFGNLLADSKVTISNNEFVNAQDSDGQVIKATSVETGAEVTLQANNWGTLETTIKGMFVGNTLTYFDAE